jgi:hypothetical protein
MPTDDDRDLPGTLQRSPGKKRKGPSDPQAANSGQAARKGVGRTYGGVDAYGNTRQELYERARKLGIKGRSRMSKAELAEAIGKRQ